MSRSPFSQAQPRTWFWVARPEKKEPCISPKVGLAGVGLVETADVSWFALSWGCTGAFPLHMMGGQTCLRVPRYFFNFFGVPVVQ